MTALAQYTWEARQDLLDLFEYVASDSGPDRAELILRRIETTVAALADWPGIGRIRDDLVGSPRVFAVWPWLIIYEGREGGGGIIIWRVIDGRRDLPVVVHPPIRG